jgi:hypothetical protein
MMTINRLHDLFESHPDRTMLGFEGNCHDCGKEVKVTVSLTPDGFAISGGAVYEPEPEKFRNKCADCFQKEPQLRNFRKCEVYSRVVGYLRPVAQWNEGKQAEFGDRKSYSL